MAPLPKIAILCGGAGTRLKPWTDHIPKALVPINDRPVIEHLLHHCMVQTFDDFVLCTGYRGDRIVEHFEQHPMKGARFAFSDAGEDASMLQRIVGAKEHIDDRFILCYGDTITDVDFHKLLSFHEESKAAATIATVAIRNPFGLVKFDNDGLALSLDEKPIMHYYIGISVIEASALATHATEDLINKPDGEGLIAFFQRLLDAKKLFTYQHSGLQITFNTDVERQKAEDEFIRFYTQQEQ